MRGAAVTSMRVPCKVDLEHLGRGANQEFPLNIHGVGKAGGWLTISHPYHSEGGCG